MRQLSGGLHLRLAILALAGCAMSRGSEPPRSAPDPAQIGYVEEHGFCAGACFRELVVTGDGKATLTLRARRSTSPTSRRSFALPAAETARLFELAARAGDRAWEPVYGCPDCADQGRLELTWRAGQTTRQTAIDPSDHPAFFDALLAELDALVDREIPAR